MNIEFPSGESYQKSSDGPFWVPFVIRLQWAVGPDRFYEGLGLDGQRRGMLLESGRYSEKTGRYSYVLFEPSVTFVSKGRCFSVEDNTGTVTQEGDPLDALKRLLGRRVVHDDALPPFLGGAAGLFSYEFKNQIERFSHIVSDPYGLPDVDMGIYDRGVVFDHRDRLCMAFVLMRGPGLFGENYEASCRRALDWADGLESRVRTALKRVSPAGDYTAFPDPDRNITANALGFKSNVSIAKEHIRQGDIFQVNLSHSLDFDFKGDPLTVYRAQGKNNPTSFAAFCDFGHYQIVCGSPERLVNVSGGVVSTRPIAGTRPRASEAPADEKLSRELRLSPKERAEHVMLIDLERNDLGRVCDFGSVHVDEFMIEETYSHVRHIVSNVRGTLAPGKDVFDVIRSVFPGGTITGAPKVRAMQIIDMLEGRSRGAYTGSLGYIGFNGRMDLNIVIRSLTLRGGKAHLQVGAGIVADSDPEHEYQETLYKAGAFLEVLRQNPIPSQRRVPVAV